MLIFSDLLPLKRPLVTILNETRAPTSRKYAAEDFKNNQKVQELLSLQSSIFSLE